MKTYLQKGIKILFIFLFLSGCTTPVYIRKTLPPEIQTGSAKTSASFVNRFDYSLPGEIREKYRDAYWLAVTEITRDVKEIFGQSELVKVQLVDTLLAGNARASFGPPLSNDTIANICKANNTPFLMVLESLDIGIDNEPVVEENSDGSKTKTQNFYLQMKAGISLYRSSGELLHQGYESSEVFYKSRPTLLAAIVIFEPSLKKAAPDIVALAKTISKQYYDKFLPQQVSERRNLYSGKEFKAIKPYFKESGWDEAIKRLIPLASSSDSKLASKAAYNLSVIYELKGNMEQSEYWGNKAGGKKPQEFIQYPGNH